MNTAELINLTGGYLKIEISGRFTGRFLNMCAANNICVWDVSVAKQNPRKRRQRYPDGVTCKISVRSYKKIRKICRATHTRARITEKCGMPFLLGRLSGRKGLIGGFVLFILLTAWLCSHVWYIEIGGNGEISDEKILSLLENAGITYGTPVFGINPDEIQRHVLSNAPELSWFRTETKGTRIFADYHTRVKKPEILDINSPCNLIASEDGRITSLLIKEGRCVVEKDMYVSKGQLLAGGVLDSNVMGVRFVHSDGEVWAQTNHTLSGRYALSAEKKIPTGRKISVWGITFGKKHLSLPFPINKFENFETKSEEFHFKIGDIYFPVSLTKSSFFETAPVTERLDREKIAEEAKFFLENTLKNSSNSVIILERTFSVTDIDENTIEVKMEAECSQQIAQKQPIENE